MTTLDSIKNRLIDKILAAQNEKFLEAIEKIFITTQKEEIVKLYPEQMEMLMMSDADIASGNVVSEQNWINRTLNGCIENCMDLNCRKTTELYF
jgi:hypothetical protein